MKISSNHLKNILMKNLYEKSRSIFCTNFKGMGFSECDVIRITESNIVYEYEIEVIKKAPKLHNFKANETLIRTVCSLLSTRTLFGGCSYIKFLNGKH